ncbi:hypothetical protein M2263_004624 [Providencia alcalifaciens]|nr:hypothetical protein [Providencia alcalifaciens]
MSKLITSSSKELSNCRDVLHRIKAFIIAAQFLNRDSSERHIANELLCQAEEEIDEALKNE